MLSLKKVNLENILQDITAAECFSQIKSKQAKLSQTNKHCTGLKKYFQQAIRSVKKIQFSGIS